MKPILCIKSDTQDVIVSIYEGEDKLASKEWQARRELSNQLLGIIKELCQSINIEVEALMGIIVYQGPGSYTGLRISISVANALGFSYKIPVVGVSGESWLQEGLELMVKSSEFSPVSPVYGGDVYTTKPKK